MLYGRLLCHLQDGDEDDFGDFGEFSGVDAGYEDQDATVGGSGNSDVVDDGSYEEEYGDYETDDGVSTFPAPDPAPDDSSPPPPSDTGEDDEDQDDDVETIPPPPAPAPPDDDDSDMVDSDIQEALDAENSQPDDQGVYQVTASDDDDENSQPDDSGVYQVTADDDDPEDTEDDFLDQLIPEDDPPDPPDLDLPGVDYTPTVQPQQAPPINFSTPPPAGKSDQGGKPATIQQVAESAAQAAALAGVKLPTAAPAKSAGSNSAGMTGTTSHPSLWWILLIVLAVVVLRKEA